MAADEETHLEVVDGEAKPLPSVPEVIRKYRLATRIADVTVPQFETFFRELEKLGTFYKAAEIAGISYQGLQHLRKHDGDFKEMCDEAMQVYRESLEREAHRRAIEGWDEPVFSQKLGTEMGVIRKYDSKLLELLLKRHIPEFREKFEGEIKVTGGVLVAPVATLTAEAWAEQHADRQIQLLADEANPPEENAG